MEQNHLDAFRKTLISLREEIVKLNADSIDATGTVALGQSKVGRLSRMHAINRTPVGVLTQDALEERQVALRGAESAPGYHLRPEGSRRRRY